MIPYSLSPYISFIDSHLVPNSVQYALAHRLSGEILQPNERVRSMLMALRVRRTTPLSQEFLNTLGADGNELRELIAREFLIPKDHDPLSRFEHWLVRTPIQNPAITYRSKEGKLMLVRTSMSKLVFAPRRGELPRVIEEELSEDVAQVLDLVDGTRTLKEIFNEVRPGHDAEFNHDTSFTKVIDFLTHQDRQLIKLTSQPNDMSNPYSPVNTVPRNLYHSHRWSGNQASDASKSIVDFHLEGIEDASWEFDYIESTVNHAFRFPSEVLGGMDYGSCFCVRSVSDDVLAGRVRAKQIEVLEVGGGTGTFARSFIRQATNKKTDSYFPKVNYHILELSPALLKNQKEVLGCLLPESRHFHQDATTFDLSGHKFDLIVCNEVAADFFMARAERSLQNAPRERATRDWQGDGASYIERFQLPTDDAPDSFLVNAGALLFIEQCWKHLLPGGAVVLSEYGAVNTYPKQTYHLNHEEFSLHFGHLAAGAAQIGFRTRIVTLKEFLQMDFDVPVLSGREEHFLCLDHLFRKFGLSIPFAVISKNEFDKKFGAIIEESKLKGVSFDGLCGGFYFGPVIEEFMVLILNKPD